MGTIFASWYSSAKNMEDINPGKISRNVAMCCDEKREWAWPRGVATVLTV